MSARFPGGANNSEAFWDLLQKGRDGCQEALALPCSRFDMLETAMNASTTPYGFCLGDPAPFDEHFFNISPREALHMDHTQRIVLLTAYEALENAGCQLDHNKASAKMGRSDIFPDVTGNDSTEATTEQNMVSYFVSGGSRGLMPGRIKYSFSFSGPSFDTACSSSLHAIHTAINSLWQRTTDATIANRTDVWVSPVFTAGLDRGRFTNSSPNIYSRRRPKGDSRADTESMNGLDSMPRLYGKLRLL
ncbi:thiolase-like protein [Thozetella sp. PMI_491]|nr:thiolase-like protein [Thozetella sp. PMI_491]